MTHKRLPGRELLLMALVLLVASAASAPRAQLQITDGPLPVLDFAWSPDDQWIAFILLGPSGQGQAFVANSFNGQVMPLTTQPRDYVSVEWSGLGDGLLLSWIAQNAGGICFALWPPQPATECALEYAQPSRITPAFGPSRQPFEVVATAESAPEQFQLVTVDMDQSMEMAVTPQRNAAFHPLWKSADRGIVYEADGDNGFLQLFEVPAAGGDECQLTTCACDTCQADEDPLEGTLVFTAPDETTGFMQLFTLGQKEAKAAPLRITSAPVDHFAPRWDPAGRAVTYHRFDREGNTNIFATTPKGGEFQITRGPDPKFFGRIDHAGGRIAYAQSDFDESSKDYVLHLYVTAIPMPGVPGEASPAHIPAEQMQAHHDKATGLIEVHYSPACDGPEHTLYYGDLSLVSSYEYTGAACGLGATGSTSFDPGLDNAFFIIVANNGVSEGSYGRDSDASERPEDTATPVCDVPQELGDVTCE